MSCSMRWRGKNCFKMGQDSLPHRLSEVGSSVMLKGMRSLLSTYQMMLFFLVCQIASSSATYLSGIGPLGTQPLFPRESVHQIHIQSGLPFQQSTFSLIVRGSPAFIERVSG